MVTDLFEFEVEDPKLDEIETEAEAAQNLAEQLRTIMAEASTGCPWYVY